MSRTETDHGFLWPSAIVPAEQRVRESKCRFAIEAAKMISTNAIRHGVCVQAGGHIGLWPLALSTKFRLIYTFEPELDNWICLTHNVQQANVFPMRAALGETGQSGTLKRDKPKSGMWFMDLTPGPIPVLAIDSLQLPTLDALVLDIEGMELHALRGAEKSIRIYRPLIWMEVSERSLRYGHNPTDAISWLRDIGYGEPVTTLKRDVMLRWE
jgi:FkbM family methyltransferase